MKHEREFTPVTGWGMLVALLIAAPVTVVIFITAVANLDHGHALVGAPLLILAIALFIASILTLVGFVVLPPNQASVMLLFGKYIGSVKTSGFFWVNPFYSKKKISLRLRNFNTDKIKVNDKEGNPIEIAAVVVWQVNDTYDASFEVDDYVDYVEVQSEAAIRHLATRYPYDSWDEKEDVISLRGHIDEVSEALERELQERLGKAGVVVREARLSHLAYASEIAEAMLKRQQAGAIVAARAKIVEGAVGMVEMALAQLKRDQIVELDEERKATMVSNLLVVLCGDSNAQPVVNTGSLYS
jgi:regulator of protease activity HflC (stomatin/prohibitin superfamily)